MSEIFLGGLSTPHGSTLSLGDHHYLVAPRGYTQWVRNAKASGVVTLRRGRIKKSSTNLSKEGFSAT
jgi:hypothetical protein